MAGPTLHEAASAWARGRAARREVAPKTLVNYQLSFDSLYRSLPPDTPIGEVTTADIEQWLATTRTQAGAPYTPGALNSLSSPVRTFFAWAARSRVVDHDPTLAVPRAKQPRRLPRRLPDHVVADLIAAADTQLARTLFLVGLHTGCRLSEIAGMRVEHWDQTRGTLTVVGKGSKERVVPVVGELAYALTRWLEHEGLHRAGPMWPSMRRPERGLTPRSIAKVIERVGVDAGHHVRPHDLRHTCASDLVEAGVDLGVVRKLLGHESLATTSVYVDATTERMRAAQSGRQYLCDRVAA